MVAPEEKSFCELEYHTSKSVVTVQRAFRAKYAVNFPVAMNNSIIVGPMVLLLQMFVITENIMRRLVFVGEMYGIHTYNIRVMGAHIERGAG
jgi:hypothetical protein